MGGRAELCPFQPQKEYLCGVLLQRDLTELEGGQAQVLGAFTDL